jgi:hypothetical protein
MAEAGASVPGTMPLPPCAIKLIFSGAEDSSGLLGRLKSKEEMVSAPGLGVLGWLATAFDRLVR